MSKNLTQTFSDVIIDKKKSFISLLVVGILVLLSVFSLNRLSFSYEIEQFFPKSSLEIDVFNQLEENTGSDKNNFLVAVSPKDGVWTLSFLEHVDELASLIDSIDNADANSLLDIHFPGPLNEVAAVRRANVLTNRNKLQTDARFSNTLIDDNGQHLILPVTVSDDPSQSQLVDIANDIELAINQFPFESYHFLGTGLIQREFIGLQKQELARFLAISIFLSLLYMAMLFRDPRLLIISGLTLIVLGLVFFGIIGVIGISLSPLMSFLPLVILIVGTADVIHFYTKYTKTRQHEDNIQSIKEAIKEVGPATFLTSVTTSAAFLSLNFTNIKAIQDFGLLSALGVMLAYFVLLFFTIPMMNLMLNKKSRKSMWLIPQNWIKSKNKNLVLIVASAIIMLSIVGSTNIKTSFNILSIIPKDSFIGKQYVFFEEELGGTRSFELALFAQRGGGFNELSTLKEVAKISQHIQVEYDSNLPISPAYPYMMAESMKTGHLALPTSQNHLDYSRRTMSQLFSMNSALVSEDGQIGRMAVNMPSFDSDVSKKMSADINDWISSNIDQSILKAEVSGITLLIDNNSDYIRKNMMTGLLLSILIVSLIVAIFFRNRKLLLLSLLPNIFPLLFACGVIGLLQIPLDSTVSIVFSILFGLVVDDTIHFLSKYQLERDKGRSVQEAVDKTLIVSGSAILHTTVLLSLAFASTFVSSFSQTKNIGIILSLSILSALFFDLFLLPLIIKAFENES